MGLGRSLTRVAASALQLARQQVGPAWLDFEEQMLRIGGLLAGALVTGLMLALALASAAATLMLYFRDGARLAATQGVTVFFLLAGVLTAWRLARALQEKPRFLEDTLAELDRDREQWRHGP